MIQTGDPTGTGRGGQSYWGTPFRDEYDLKGAAKHDARGVLSMANSGKDTNSSQFFLTFRSTPHLDNKHTVFGKLVGGEEQGARLVWVICCCFHDLWAPLYPTVCARTSVSTLLFLSFCYITLYSYTDLMPPFYLLPKSI